MSDEATNGDRPRIISLGDVIEQSEPAVLTLAEMREKRRKVAREELDNDLTELSFGILNQYQQLRAVVEAQQVAIRSMVEVLQSMERRTMRGRLRTAFAWLALQRETIRGYAIELGIASPVPSPPTRDGG